MAIPHWTWPESEQDAGARLAAATGTFDALSDPTRAAIVGALFEADAPLSYTELASAAEVEHNGRLNYHLRQLDDLVVDGEGGYALSTAGRELVTDVLDAAAVGAD